MIADRNWRAETFAPYFEERSERMRRLRFTASAYSFLSAEFGEMAVARRRRFHDAMSQDPAFGMSRLSAIFGPELPTAEAFSPR